MNPALTEADGLKGLSESTAMGREPVGLPAQPSPQGSSRV